MANEVKIKVVAEDKTKGTFTGLKAGMKSVIAGAAALGTGIAVAMVKASEAARESAKIQAQTAAVIKSTGGAANISAKQVEAMAGRISKLTGVDDELIQSGENMLLTFTNIRNDLKNGNMVFDEATMAITDMSVALGQDMKSSAMQVGKALNDPIKGITALKRVGVTFNEEQIKTITHLAKTGKTAEAQRLILAELRKEFGGSAEAQATWADKAKVAVGNVQEAFGTLVNRAFEPVAKWFVKEGGPALEDFFEKLKGDKDLKNSIKDLGRAINDLTGNKDFRQSLNDIADNLPKIVDGLTDVLNKYREIATFIDEQEKKLGGDNLLLPQPETMDKQRKALARVWDAMKSDFASAKADITGDMRGMSADAGRVWDAMKSDFRGAKNAFGRTWDAMKSDFRGAKTAVIRTAHEAATGISNWFKRLPGWVSGHARDATDRLRMRFNEAKTMATQKAREIVNGFINRFNDIVGRARDEAGKVKAAITSRFSGAINWLRNAGRDVIRGLGDGLKNQFDKVKSWVSGIAKWIKDHKGPISLDRQLLVPAGKALMGGLLEGLKFGFDGVGEFVYKAGSKVSDIIDSIQGSFLGDWQGAIGSGTFSGRGNRLLNAIRNTFGVGGGTYPGHGERGASKAWDFMVPISGRLGDAIASFSKTFAKQLGVMYVIWNKRIWSVARNSEGWRPYTRYGSSGSPSQMHTNHVHVSLFDKGGILRGFGINTSGQPERVLSPAQTRSFDRLVSVISSGRGNVGGNTYVINAPNYVGDKQDLVKALVDLDKQHRLAVIKR